MLKKRLKDSNNEKFGIVVAISRNQLGYSLCNKKAGDIYNEEFGLKKAVGRAKSQKVTDVDFWKKVFNRKMDNYSWTLKNDTVDVIVQEIPFLIKEETVKLPILFEELEIMQERAIKYFKDLRR